MIRAFRCKRKNNNLISDKKELEMAAQVKNIILNDRSMY